MRGNLQIFITDSSLQQRIGSHSTSDHIQTKQSRTEPPEESTTIDPVTTDPTTEPTLFQCSENGLGCYNSFTFTVISTYYSICNIFQQVHILKTILFSALLSK